VSDDPDYVLDSLAEAAIAFARAMDRNRHRLEAKYGLTASEMRAYIYVARVAEATPKQIADHMGVTTAAMTYISRSLIERGLFQRRAHEVDGRSTVLELSPAAHDQMQQMHDDFNRLTRTAASWLDAADRDGFTEHLKTMTAGLHAAIDHIESDHH
jgi:DNA-binding MarR family transcriptional regulator